MEIAARNGGWFGDDRGTPRRVATRYRVPLVC